MQWQRASGILLHPTSFPSRYGIGDLGPGARDVLDFLAASRQRLWQMLPLGPTGYGNSPYASLSAFAGNPLLISPDLLVQEQLLPSATLADVPDFPRDHVDYDSVVPWKLDILRASHRHFCAHAPHGMRDEYEQFCAAQQRWLDEYALFMVLRAAHGDIAWTRWPQPYARREPSALEQARIQFAGEIAFHKYIQFLFFRQWAALKCAAQQRSIALIGDLAIFVAHGSADVWGHPELFLLDERGMPTSVAGVPPDYFSATGQRWGNPLYRWDTLATQGYAWWIERVRQALNLVDYIRLDHFRGFEAYWEIPSEAETAAGGRWVPGPGAALFTAIRQALGEAPFIAEDLGLITPEVHALRDALGFPGMHVLQFAFGSGPANTDLPHHYVHNTVVYTGTHDNDTSRGWLATLDAQERAFVLKYLATDREHAVWAMLRAAFASVANMAIVPMQDVLNLGTEARMNFPARPEGNWEWRLTSEQLDPTLAARLADLSATYER